MLQFSVFCEGTETLHSLKCKEETYYGTWKTWIWTYETSGKQ